jgi:hypothetical protein
MKYATLGTTSKNNNLAINMHLYTLQEAEVAAPRVRAHAAAALCNFVDEDDDDVIAIVEPYLDRIVTLYVAASLLSWDSISF